MSEGTREEISSEKLEQKIDILCGCDSAVGYVHVRTCTC